MFKKALLAAAFVVASSPAFVSAQDIFFSFDDTTPTTSTTGAVGTTGTVSIFSTLGFNFDAVDLDFFSSDTSVVQFTGGTIENPLIFGSFRYNGTPDPVTGADQGDGGSLIVNAGGADGTLFGVNLTQNGVNDNFAAFPGIDPTVRTGLNALLLAEIDYSIVGDGTADFTLQVGDEGVATNGGLFLSPTLGSASLVGVGAPGPGPGPAIPEPSSAILLVLGAAGMVARRRRS